MPEVLFPPRPKGRMNSTDLPFYEQSGLWCAQRKFNGTRNLIHILPDRKVVLWNRHGQHHSKYSLTNKVRDQLLSCLTLEKGKEYWLDGELMNKQVNATNELVLYDVLQAGRYLFGTPNQMARLELLKAICNDPQEKEPSGTALQISPGIWMAETWVDGFMDRFNESLTNPRLEGLVLRKKDSAIDHFGAKEYETGNIIRCRKPFASDKGYNF